MGRMMILIITNDRRITNITRMKTNYKINDNVEFLDTPVKNWRYGKIIGMNTSEGTYRIYSGTDLYTARPVKSKDGRTIELQSI